MEKKNNSSQRCKNCEAFVPDKEDKNNSGKCLPHFPRAIVSSQSGQYCKKYKDKK
jgi:hypothetical protein